MTMTDHPGSPLTYGMQYRLPALPVQLPLEIHPGYKETRPRVHRWLRPYLLDYFGENDRAPRRTDRCLKQGTGYWGAMCFPHARPDRIFAVLALMVVMTLQDDAFGDLAVRDDEAARARLRDELFSAVDGVPGSDFALGRMVRAGQALLTPPDGVTARMNAANKQAIASSAALPAGGSLAYPDLDSYLAERRIDIYGWWMMDLAEWILGIDLAGRATGDPLLLRACTLVIDHIILVNDIYSFPKEIGAGETLNGVWLLMRHEGMSLQQALDHLAARAVSGEQDFITIRDQILNGILGRHPGIPVFLRELGHMIPGNIRFHRWTTRYSADTTGLCS